MTKIDIFSGFLGAGKTTLIKKLIQEAYQGEKLVLIENEFGEIGIDGGFLQDAGVEITEMNSGCICCSLVGDFREALKKVVETYHPDRILIEPSGVGKLSDVTRAVEGVGETLPVSLMLPGRILSFLLFLFICRQIPSLPHKHFSSWLSFPSLRCHDSKPEFPFPLPEVNNTSYISCPGEQLAFL